MSENAKFSIDKNCLNRNASGNNESNSAWEVMECDDDDDLICKKLMHFLEFKLNFMFFRSANCDNGGDSLLPCFDARNLRVYQWAEGCQRKMHHRFYFLPHFGIFLLACRVLFLLDRFRCRYNFCLFVDKRNGVRCLVDIKVLGLQIIQSNSNCHWLFQLLRYFVWRKIQVLLLFCTRIVHSGRGFRGNLFIDIQGHIWYRDAISDIVKFRLFCLFRLLCSENLRFDRS